jgi:hypothetical protein
MKSFYDMEVAERIALTEQAMAEKQTLMRRWSNLPMETTSDWTARAAKAAALLADCEAVVDLGCGTMNLKRYLSSTTHYLPVDVVAHRDEQTMVVDFNREAPPALDSNAAACLGLLEYLYNVKEFLESLAKCYRILVVSYNPFEAGDSLAHRRSHAWVNDFPRQRLEELYVATGWEIIRTDQILKCEFLWRLERRVPDVFRLCRPSEL